MVDRPETGPPWKVSRRSDPHGRGWLSMSFKRRSVRLYAFLFFAWTLSLVGCRAHPLSLTLSTITARFDREDLQRRRAALEGKTIEAADRLFRARNDVLDPLDGGPAWVVFEDDRGKASESFYVVEATPDGRIVNVFKTKRNLAGLADIWRIRQVLKTCFTLTEEECESQAALGPRFREFLSRNTGYRAVFYDPRVTPLEASEIGLRDFTILCFNEQDLCVDVRRVGVTAGRPTP